MNFYMFMSVLFIIIFPTPFAGVPNNELFLYGSNGTKLPIDRSSLHFDLTDGFVLLGNKYNSFRAFSSGWVHFNSNNNAEEKYVFIKPYHAIIDLKSGGNVYFDTTNEPKLVSKAECEICKRFPELENLGINWLFIGTWENVLDKNCNKSDTNTFQLVLASNGIQSFAIFYYNELNWWRGCYHGMRADAEFVIYYRVGNKKTRYESLPGSRKKEILNLVHKSNIGESGKWVYRIDQKIVPFTNFTTIIKPEGNKPCKNATKSLKSMDWNFPTILFGCLAIFRN